MNHLPTHRSAQLGRTWPTSWSASDYDPIEMPAWRRRRLEQAASVLLATVLGALIAVALISWWSA